MRLAGEQAYSTAKVECGLHDRHGENASGDYNSWSKRLDAARRAKAQGKSPFANDGLLFHKKTGFVEVRRRATDIDCSWESIWGKITQ
eukprot:1219292-Prymnesium_polylepis.1